MLNNEGTDRQLRNLLLPCLQQPTAQIVHVLRDLNTQACIGRALAVSGKHQHISASQS